MNSRLLAGLCPVLVLFAMGHHSLGAASSDRSASSTKAAIVRTRVFEEPLIPVGGEPSAQENSSLAEALQKYGRRQPADNFSSLTEFLKQHPDSPWNAALLAGLGIEYYNSAYYSRAVDAWKRAWELTREAKEQRAKAIADRTAGELAYMYARLGRMEDLDALLKSVEGRTFVGPATEKISGAREALWTMNHRPEIAFRCGPLALHRIKAMGAPAPSVDMAIFESASTRQGISLPDVAELSRKVGLNYQMAFREAGAPLMVPSVIHWKLGHYAAVTRQQGARFLVQDPTFGNDVWAGTNALDSEASGYFLVPAGPLPKGWRTVGREEGEKIWGKGVTSNNDPRITFPDAAYLQAKCEERQAAQDIMRNIQDKQNDVQKAAAQNVRGMAVPGVHLMVVSLGISDTPVGYSPPVGPSVLFNLRYAHREAFQPSTFSYANFGPKWTCDWISYITDNPQSPAADVNYYVRGGGTKTFTGFDTNTSAFAHQQYGQARLGRTGPDAYEMVDPDGSRMVFSRPDGASGTSRKVFLTQVVDPFGNAVTLNYDNDLRLTNIVDAMGQATTLTYTNVADIYKITRVTDPFGRFASFQYDQLGRLTNITDTVGIQSGFTYEGTGDFITALRTPYGTTSFTRGGGGSTRWLELLHPDGSRERAEYNQSSNLGVPFSEPVSSVPRDMSTFNQWLYARNTFYWSRTASATAYGDYSKAKIYHWLHTVDLATTAGILESVKEPFEGRVWYEYPGQGAALTVGSSSRPRRVGRVLDDSSTQLHRFEYNEFGKVTNSVDPVGRSFSYLYATNGIDLLEVRMTRAGKNELLYSATYNDKHLPLTTTDAAGQTTFYSYNTRGQILSVTNARAEVTTFSYNTNGFLTAVDGPLPGTNDLTTATYDSFGRLRTSTDPSGYTVTLDYDALDRLTRATYPDATYEEITYHRLDQQTVRDRAGRVTQLEFNSMRDLVKRIDPLGRITQFQWCRCGSIKSLTDPMGRTTQWHTDEQGRLIAKEYGDGTKVTYTYENTTSRLRQVADESGQIKHFTWTRDDALQSMSYLGSTVTPSVQFAYDPDYPRLTSRTDGIGTTVQHYVPITTPPTLGAGRLASIDGPWANDTITHDYDELGRRVANAINGMAHRLTFDPLGRVISETNALGSFSYTYDGSSRRRATETAPNGLVATRTYDDAAHDFVLKQITHQAGATPVSSFGYTRDHAAERIGTWSHQLGSAAAQVYGFSYDAADQLLTATITNAGVFAGQFSYQYDLLGNRLREETPAVTNLASYNALNQLSVVSGAAIAGRTNEWDAQDRLRAVNTATARTEFTYDGTGQRIAIRHFVNGAETANRRFLWSDGRISEERDASGAVVKRFFSQGVKIEVGPQAGSYFYTRDHLGSIRELTDSTGAVRARYQYDPFGRRTLFVGDVAADFGFAGMFWSEEAQLGLTLFRAYDPEQGRWLSRDPLLNAEMEEGANLYAYVGNNPVNAFDPLGLCCEQELTDLMKIRSRIPINGAPYCDALLTMRPSACTGPLGPTAPDCVHLDSMILTQCELPFQQRLTDCLSKPCQDRPCKPAAAPPGPPPPVPARRLPESGPDQATYSTGRPAERNAATGPPHSSGLGQ